MKLREIVRSEQLTMGLEAGEFWAARPISELAAERGVGPIQDVEVLRDHEASDEEVDRVLAALGEM